MNKTLIWSIATGIAVILIFIWIYREPAPEPQTFTEVFTNDIENVDEASVLRRSDGETDQAVTSENATIQALLDDLGSMEVQEVENQTIEPDYIVSFDQRVVEFSENYVMIFGQDGVKTYEILEQGEHLNTIENDLEFETVQSQDNSSSENEEESD
ncbi:hypothetical protein [Alkalibacillus salilacus]|uniref:DUF4366 domain-containing protein n=1 Tax=Alkalibacillus salilacus TaxID=284582 RepID=A0ABT9VGF1_9BACI|nr:hypothetical protein [Alkalibacillus salilacus]MDQ0160042.1 hypothetical protein [Alkalibacillus salilacus]